MLPQPAVRTIELTEDDEFLIIASDGLWDVISYQDAVNIVRRKLVGIGGEPKQEICDALLNKALERKTQDNTTVILVFFVHMPEEG